MTKKDRALLYAFIRRELKKSEARIIDHVDYALREEAQLHLLKQFAEQQPSVPS